MNNFSALVTMSDDPVPGWAIGIFAPMSRNLIAFGSGPSSEAAFAEAAFMIPGQHHAVFQHGAEMYEVYRTVQADTDRFPQKWPKAGWYWERGVPSTTIIYKQAGPFQTGAAAYLDVLRQEMK